MAADPVKPVRSWMNDHPVTSYYIAFIVTLLLVLELLD